MFSTNLYGQTDTPSLKGVSDSLVVVDIMTIKEANVKLLERKMFKEIAAQQDTIILNQNVIIDKYKQENLYLVSSNIDLDKKYKESIELNNKINKSLQRTKIGLYITGGVSIATMTYIIINSIINGK